MSSIDIKAIAEALAQIKSGGWKIVVAASGAGAGITDLLWQIPGASEFLLATYFPYSRAVMRDFLGHEIETFCSEEATVALAARAYSEGLRALWAEEKLQQRNKLIAVGLTGAVTTARERRGEDRIHVAVRTVSGFFTAAIDFEKGALDRESAGELSDALALNAVFAAAGIPQVPVAGIGIRGGGIARAADGAVTLALESPLSRGLKPGPEPLVVKPDGSVVPLGEFPHRPEQVVFPGAFNPLHFGHEEMARFAERWLGRQVLFEISAATPHKALLDEEELAKRVVQFRGRWPVIVSASVPLYLDKAAAYRRDVLMGADAFNRMLDLRFYPKDTSRDVILEAFRSIGTHFLVFSRTGPDGRIQRGDEFVSSEYHDLLTLVPARWRVSSSELRDGQPG